MDEDVKKRKINEIINLCKANGTYVSGDLFLSLAFRTDNELDAICNELRIKR